MRRSGDALVLMSGEDRLGQSGYASAGPSDGVGAVEIVAPPGTHHCFGDCVGCPKEVECEPPPVAA